MLQVDALHTGYGPLPVIHGVTLSIDEGESIALLGANGAGKSTLLKTIAGWLPVQSGTLRWDGTDATGWDPVRRTANGIIIVPQDNKVFGELSVEANLEISAAARSDGRERLAAVYERFPLLRDRAKQRAGSLSGGERQLVAVISAMVLAPRLLLLDEPTSGLSPVMVEAVCELIKEVIDDGVAVVWVVEQDPETALEYVDRAVVMAGGRIVGSADAAEVERSVLSNLVMGGDEEAAAIADASGERPRPVGSDR